MSNLCTSEIAGLDTFVQTLHSLARFRPRSTSPSFGDIYQLWRRRADWYVPIEIECEYCTQLNNSAKELCLTCMRWLCSVRCGYISIIIQSDLLKSRMTSARGISVLFSSGDLGVGDGDPDPATHSCFQVTNDGLNVTKFIPGFPASYVIFVFMVNVLTPINRCPEEDLVTTWVADGSRAWPTN